MITSKRGFIILPLLLVLSISGFLLVHALAADQKQVTAAIDASLDLSSYKYSLSRHIGNSNDWKTYQNKKFNFAIKYPQYWQTQENARPSFGLYSFEASLDPKIKLTVIVVKSYYIPESVKKNSLENVDFYWVRDEEKEKTAVTQNGKYYYMIDLSNDNFFTDNTEFRATFTKILKTFKASS